MKASAGTGKQKRKRIPIKNLFAGSGTFLHNECMKNKKYENIAEEIKKMKTFIKWCEKNYDELTEKEQDLICDFKNDSEDLFNW